MSSLSRSDFGLVRRVVGAGVGVGMLRGFLVSCFFCFFGFLVSWFLGFRFHGFLVSKVLGFLVSKFQRFTKFQFYVFLVDIDPISKNFEIIFDGAAGFSCAFEHCQQHGVLEFRDL